MYFQHLSVDTCIDWRRFITLYKFHYDSYNFLCRKTGKWTVDDTEQWQKELVHFSYMQVKLYFNITTGQSLMEASFRPLGIVDSIASVAN